MVDTETYIDTEERQPDPQPKPKKLSVKDFATKIKQKYPDYKDIDDKVLTDKIIAKYPVYKDQVELTPNVKKKNLRSTLQKYLRVAAQMVQHLRQQLRLIKAILLQ